MSDLMQVAIITACGADVAAVIGCIAAVIAARRGKQNADAIQKISINIDGRLQQLLDAQLQIGQIKERDEERSRNKPQPPAL